MKIIYTEHAEQRALLRGIKKEWIEEAIRNPDKLAEAKEGKKQAIKRVDANSRISVIYAIEENEVVVITIFWGE